MEQKPLDFKGLSKESFDNWKKFFRDNFVFTKIINPKEISDPIVSAIQDKEIPIVSADEISSPIVDALYKVQESVELKETSFPETIKVGIEGVSVIAIKGDPGEPGYTPKKGIDYFDGDDGYTPKKFKDYFTKEEIEKIIKQIEKKIRVPKDGKDGISPIADIDYPSHNQIKKQLEELVALVPKPKDGFTPKHEWNTNNQIRFENPDGTWGEWSKSLELKNNGGGYSFSGYTNFLELHDTPTTYVGQALKVARVNAAENAIEFATPSAAGVSGTINELAYFDSASSIASLAVATYPSLAELAHVKGVTSSIQTQLDAKLDDSQATAFGLSLLDDANAAAGRTTLGVVIGTNVQAYSANLDEYAGVNPTVAGLALLDDADATAQLVTLGLTATATELNYTDGVTSAIQTQIDAKLASSAYTAADVLTKLLTVDGAGSGLDADLLDGNSSAAFATSTQGTTADNALPKAGGTMTGNITLGENTSVALDPAGSADGKYSGITVAATAGEALAFGDVIVLDVTAGKWFKGSVSAAAGADGDLRGGTGMCVLAAAGDASATTVLLMGTCRADANFPALTIGSVVYASTTGDITVTQPSTTDHIIKVLGYALTSDEIMFQPSMDYITHT